jgi:hypothetical protein
VDLNKDINIDLKQLKPILQKLLTDKSKIPYVTLTISILVGLLCLMVIFSKNTTKNDYEDAAQLLLTLDQQIVSSRKNLDNLIIENKSILGLFAKSPKTKSQMTEAVTKLVTQNQLQLVKLNMAENEGTQTVSDPTDPNNGKLLAGEILLDMEIIGNFSQVNRFILDAKKIFAASKVQRYEVSKLSDKETNGLKLNLIVRFSGPPTNLAVPEPDDVALIFDDGYSLFFNKQNPWMQTVGFVEVDPKQIQMPDQSSPLKNGEAFVNSDNNSFDRDPFATPEDAQLAPSSTAAGNVKNNSSELDDSAPVYFLSGILASDDVSMCTVNMPSGETKIFTSGDKIDDQITVMSIDIDHIKICGVCKGNYKKIKLGDEITF